MSGLVLATLFAFSCSPSQQDLRRQLESLAQTDLEDILQDLKARKIDSLASHRPYYRIMDYRVFEGDTARKFAAYAEVHFYYLKSLDLHQERKYRYSRSLGSWDRYQVELRHNYRQVPAE